jgi:hypothetical protein
MNIPCAVANDWLKYQVARNEKGNSFETSEEKERYWWAVEQLMEWTRDDPERCWSTILEIWGLVDHHDLETLSALGAGAVVVLLCDYGYDYFPFIEKFGKV